MTHMDKSAQDEAAALADENDLREDDDFIDEDGDGEDDRDAKQAAG